MVVHIRIAIIAGEGSLKRCDCQIDLPQFGEDAAEISAGFDEIFIDLDRVVVPLPCRPDIA